MGGGITPPPDPIEETFTVTFNANAPKDTSVSGTMEAQTFTEGTAQTLTKNTFSIEGYKFIGWADSQTATEAKYTDEQEITITVDITLYAVWEKEGTPPEENKHTITFMVNAPEGFTAQGSMPPQSSTELYITLAKNAFSIEGHTFKGWAKDASSKEAEYEDAKENFMLIENIVLYAVWEYWLSVDENGNLIVQDVDDVPQNVVIPEGATTIGEQHTFPNFSMFTDDIYPNLKSIKIPSSVKKINTGFAFGDKKAGFWPFPVYDKRTKGLPFKFIVDENNPHFKTNDSGNMLLSKDGTELYFVTNSSSDYTIPSTVKSIMESAFIGANIQSINLDGITLEANCDFQYCDKLASVELKNITTVGNFLYAFRGCANLKRADLSESGITKMNQQFFDGCTNLSEVKLPSMLTELNDHVFTNCTSLESLTIPASLKSIKSNVFGESGIKTIKFEGTKEQWGAIDFPGNEYDKEFLNNVTVTCSDGVYTPPAE